jgi:hypothetical protein
LSAAAYSVMPGLSPSKTGVNALMAGHPRLASFDARKTWMAGTSPAMTAKICEVLTRYFAAVTTISTICGGSSSTPMQARIGGLLVSTHSSQARFISPLRFMSAM